MTDKRYKSIVSLGHFCSVAMELERLGFRSVSLPFDWLITEDFSIVIELIQSEFDHFLDTENLIQETEVALHYYYDTECHIHFYHDFSSQSSLSDQIDAVRGKYDRRIARLYEIIRQPTLFVRYCCERDYVYIQNNYQEIVRLLRSFNPMNDIVFVCNENTPAFPEQAMVYYVPMDKNDTVARRFLKKNKEMKAFIVDHLDIDCHVKKQNIRLYRRKQRIKFFRKLRPSTIARKMKQVFK